MRAYLASFGLSLLQWFVMMIMVLSMLDLAGVIHLANVRFVLLGW